MEKPKRLTLKYIEYYPTPSEIYSIIMESEGWPYKTNREFYLTRDRALVAILYLLALRISEALRLKKKQFLLPEETGYQDRVLVRGIKLSKSRIKVCKLCGKSIKAKERKQHLKVEHGIETSDVNRYFKDKPRKEQYRQEAYLPLTGPRAPLTQLVLDWLQKVPNKDDRVFKIGRKRAWEVIKRLTRWTCHWFRAFGEDYLYSQWNGDLLAVADYVKVDPRTLQEYIRRRYEKYQVV